MSVPSDAEENVEVRRVMVERVGWERISREGGAVAVHYDATGRLWETTAALEGDRWSPKARFVEVVNSTPEPTGRAGTTSSVSRPTCERPARPSPGRSSSETWSTSRWWRAEVGAPPSREVDFAAWMAFESVSEFADHVRLPWQGKRALHFVMQSRGCAFGEALMHLVEQGTIIQAASHTAVVDLARYTALVEELEAPRTPR